MVKIKQINFFGADRTGKYELVRITYEVNGRVLEENLKVDLSEVEYPELAEYVIVQALRQFNLKFFT